MQWLLPCSHKKLTKPSLFGQKWSETLSHRCETWRYFNTRRVGRRKENEEIFNGTMKAWVKLVSDVPCLPCLPWRNKLKFWSAMVKFCFLNQNWRFLLTIWKLSNYSYPFDFAAHFHASKWKSGKNHKRSIEAIYLCFISYLMTFVTGPLVCHLGRRKRRASRE